jgi:hypothetical protein
MNPRNHAAAASTSLRRYWIAIASMTLAIGLGSSETRADGFDGPSFRKGVWHFVRTLDLVFGENHRRRLLDREMTRCVDPTRAMKATFASPSIGNCVSAKAERVENKYTFSNRCDYMGPVSTTIIVQSDESYTELNELKVGQLPKTELIVARRVGDCLDDSPNSSDYSN